MKIKLCQERTDALKINERLQFDYLRQRFSIIHKADSLDRTMRDLCNSNCPTGALLFYFIAISVVCQCQTRRKRVDHVNPSLQGSYLWLHIKNVNETGGPIMQKYFNRSP